MRFAAAETQPRLGDVEANLRECGSLVATAAHEGAQVVVLPEFFTTGMAYLPSMRTQRCRGAPPPAGSPSGPPAMT